MKAPSLLCFVALLFWGWHTQRLVPALVLAVALESARFVSLRFELGVAQVARAFDVGLGLLIAAAVLLASRERAQDAVLSAGGWLPLALLPFMLAHRYGSDEAFDVRALWWRAQRFELPPMPPLLIDPAWLYAPLCVLSASIEAARSPAFYAGAALIGAWMLYPARSQRLSIVAWALLVLATAGLGYGAQAGLFQLQKLFIDITMGLITGTDTDPLRKTTAIGEIGELKFSGAILVRVSSPSGGEPPRYLHRASYNRYAGGTWYTKQAPLRALQPSAQRGAIDPTKARDWELAPALSGGRRLSIAANAAGEQSVLPLPLGTSAVHGLHALSVRRNRLGTVQVSGSAAVLRFESIYNERAAQSGAASQQDLSVLERDRVYLQSWLDAQQLTGKPPASLARELAARMQRDFRYSLFQSEAAAGPLPIRRFLEHSRAGHCEYFAAATVLLLRTAGIPARYATGYVVEEFSALEELYVVRARHAHAWARVFIDGAWHNLDTTPSNWLAAEREQSSALQPLFDLVALALYRFRSWRAADGNVVQWLAVLVGLVIVVLAARRLRRRRVERVKRSARVADALRPVRGRDSEFYRVIERLQAHGHAPLPGEAGATWVRRAAPYLAPELRIDFEALATLHQRHRFDPRGLDAASRVTLAEGVDSWLGRMDVARPRDGSCAAPTNDTTNT